MTNIKTIFALLLCFLLSGLACSCSNDNNDDNPNNGNINKNDASKEPSLVRLEFPNVAKVPGNHKTIIHTTNDRYGINYSVEWDSDLKSQRWSCMQMHKNQFVTKVTRSDNFQEDPLLSYSDRFPDTRSLYSGSGFQRGHIVASADRLYSKEANEQTFYYSNMQPQYGMFNAGGNNDSPWNRLENQVRAWAKTTSKDANGKEFVDTLFVVKGGTIDEGMQLKKIQNVLIVPKYFFMAILKRTADGYSAIGFWLEHDNLDHSKNSLAEYAVNIETLEKLTGYDFFCNLPDNEEKRVESMDKERCKVLFGLAKANF